jgi:GH43 family beta-xylosidase
MTHSVFTIKSSTETKNGNFCNKLVNKDTISIETEFGTVKQERQSTYYLFTQQQNEVGKQAGLNLALFDVIEKPYTIKNDEGIEEEIILKYLYPKRG